MGYNFKLNDYNLSYLSNKDPILRDIINTIGNYKIELNKDYYVSLVRTIIGQQLSVKAANTIFSRVENLCKVITPNNIFNTCDDDLRNAGVSWAKIKYIKHLTNEVINNQIDLNNIANLSNEDIIYELTQIKGIGRWTAEMFMIFSLGKLDIFSVSDAGLRRSIKINYKLQELPSQAEMKIISETWKPYRSIASLYLWASLDNNPQ